MPEKPLLVLVEGNICAGKSSLCEQLSQHLGFEVAIEPTTKNPWLELYYQDPKQYALPMQIWLLQQRYGVYCEAVKTLMQRPGPQGIILDRSIFSDAVFAVGLQHALAHPSGGRGKYKGKGLPNAECRGRGAPSPGQGPPELLQGTPGPQVSVHVPGWALGTGLPSGVPVPLHAACRTAYRAARALLK